MNEDNINKVDDTNDAIRAGVYLETNQDKFTVSPKNSNGSMEILNSFLFHKKNFNPVIKQDYDDSWIIDMQSDLKNLLPGSIIRRFHNSKLFIQSEDMCDDLTHPIIENICRVPCSTINGEAFHKHFCCILCKNINRSSLVKSTNSMVIHNSLFHIDLKKSKNQKLIRLSSNEALEITQGIIYSALDARSHEAREFLSLEN